MTSFVYKYVFRLNISMNNTISVDFFDCEDELSEVDPCTLFTQSAIRLLVDHISHVTAWHIVS